MAVRGAKDGAGVAVDDRETGEAFLTRPTTVNDLEIRKLEEAEEASRVYVRALGHAGGRDRLVSGEPVDLTILHHGNSASVPYDVGCLRPLSQHAFEGMAYNHLPFPSEIEKPKLIWLFLFNQLETARRVTSLFCRERRGDVHSDESHLVGILKTTQSDEHGVFQALSPAIAECLTALG